MRELSQKRAICAMPIAGSYRSIDFTLSNMTNSHIQKVAVFTQYNARSLNEHLNSSKWWDFGRKQGGIKQKTGANFQDLLQQRRFQAAVKLLEETDLSIEDISLDVGYENQSYFFRQFKKRFGTCCSYRGPPAQKSGLRPFCGACPFQRPARP